MHSLTVFSFTGHLLVIKDVAKLPSYIPKVRCRASHLKVVCSYNVGECDRAFL